MEHMGYQAFGLEGTDCVTINDISSYNCNNMWRAGWRMVGICNVQEGDEAKNYGVYVKPEAECVASVQEELKEETKKRQDAETKIRKLEERTKELQKVYGKHWALVSELRAMACEADDDGVDPTALGRILDVSEGDGDDE